MTLHVFVDEKRPAVEVCLSRKATGGEMEEEVRVAPRATAKAVVRRVALVR